MLDKFYAWVLHLVTERYREELLKEIPTGPKKVWSSRSLKVMKMIEYASSLDYDLRGEGTEVPDENGDYFNLKVRYNGRNTDMKMVNVNMRDIMAMSPGNVAKVQHTTLKKHAIETLMNVVDLIKYDKYDELEKCIKWSPADGEQGTDKYFIDFTYDPCMQEEGTDIAYILDELIRLDKLSKQGTEGGKSDEGR